MVQVISQRTFCPHQRYLHSFRSKRTAGTFSRLAQCWGKAQNFENLPPKDPWWTLKPLFSWLFSPTCLATVTSCAKEICNQTPDSTTNIHTWINISSSNQQVYKTTIITTTIIILISSVVIQNMSSSWSTPKHRIMFSQRFSSEFGWPSWIKIHIKSNIRNFA